MKRVLKIFGVLVSLGFCYLCYWFYGYTNIDYETFKKYCYYTGETQEEKERKKETSQRYIPVLGVEDYKSLSKPALISKMCEICYAKGIPYFNIDTEYYSVISKKQYSTVNKNILASDEDIMVKTGEILTYGELKDQIKAQELESKYEDLVAKAPIANPYAYTKLNKKSLADINYRMKKLINEGEFGPSIAIQNMDFDNAKYIVPNDDEIDVSTLIISDRWEWYNAKNKSILITFPLVGLENERVVFKIRKQKEFSYPLEVVKYGVYDFRKELKGK